MDIVYHDSGLFSTEVASIYKEVYGTPILITAKSRSFNIMPIVMGKSIPAVGVIRSRASRDFGNSVMELIALDACAIIMKANGGPVMSVAKAIKKNYKSSMSHAYASAVLKLMGTDGFNNYGSFELASKHSTNILSEEF